MSKQTKSVKKVSSTKAVTVQLQFTEQQHRCLSGLAAFQGESIEEFIGRATRFMAVVESGEVENQIKEVIGHE